MEKLFEAIITKDITGIANDIAVIWQMPEDLLMDIYLMTDTMQRRNLMLIVMCFATYYYEENHSELNFEQSINLFKEQIHEFMVKTAKMAIAQNIKLKVFPAELILEGKYGLHSPK